MTDLPSAGDVTRLAAGVEALSRSTRDNTDAIARVTVTARRQRFGLVLTAIGLVADLILSGLFVYQHIQQSCTNVRSQQFFDAEIGKVAGQIVGEQQKLHGVRMILRREGVTGLAEYVRGEEQWIAASRHYLETIHSIKDHC